MIINKLTGGSTLGPLRKYATEIHNNYFSYFIAVSLPNITDILLKP